MELVETGPDTGIFVSQAVMLTANALDNDFSVARGFADRVRLAGLEHGVREEYTAVLSDGRVVPLEAPATVFRRDPDERGQIPFRVINYVGDHDEDPSMPE